MSKPRWVGGFPTEEAAKAARDVARVAARRGEYVDKSRITVERYLLEWLDAHALEVKPRTRAGYEHVIRSYVIPHIGRMKLQAVRPSTLSSLYRQLLESGGRRGQPLSTRSVEYVHAVLRKALNDAVRSEQILTSNPAERAKRPRKQARGARDVWDAQQLRAFLGTAEGHRLFALFRLAAYTGARRGELLNLRWKDVTFEGSPCVRIRGSVSVIDGKRVEGTPKGGRERVVSIGAETVEVLVHVVAARLGHADPAITLRVYAHVLGDQASEAADVFARVVDGA